MVDRQKTLCAGQLLPYDLPCFGRKGGEGRYTVHILESEQEEETDRGTTADIYEGCCGKTMSSCFQAGEPEPRWGNLGDFQKDAQAEVCEECIRKYHMKHDS